MILMNVTLSLVLNFMTLTKALLPEVLCPDPRLALLLHMRNRALHKFYCSTFPRKMCKNIPIIPLKNHKLAASACKLPQPPCILTIRGPNDKMNPLDGFENARKNKMSRKNKRCHA